MYMSLVDLPSVAAVETSDERRHWFIGRSCLHLEVGALFLLALVATEQIGGCALCLQ